MGFFVYDGLKTRFFCVGNQFMNKINPVLHERLATLIGSMGYELLGCELLPQGRQMIFRIYIDGKDGVTLDDCTRVSYQVSAMLDVEDPIQGHYSLEVSSPGIDRPLFEIEHFRRFIGKLVKIRLRSPVNQRKQFKGILQRVEGENIYLLLEETGQEVTLPYSAVDKANLVGDVSFK